MADDNNKEIMDLVAGTDKSIQWTDGTDDIQALSATLKRRRQINFLKAYMDCGTIRTACTSTGINPSSVRQWRENDEWFRKQYADAEQNYRDLIEQEVHDRAIIGEQVPIVGKVLTPAGREDQIIGYKTVKSDLLLMFHAKRHIREYRDKYAPDPEGDKPVRESPMVQINVLIDRIAEKATIALPPSNPAQLHPSDDDVIDITPEP